MLAAFRAVTITHGEQTKPQTNVVSQIDKHSQVFSIWTSKDMIQITDGKIIDERTKPCDCFLCSLPYIERVSIRSSRLSAPCFFKAHQTCLLRYSSRESKTMKLRTFVIVFLCVMLTSTLLAQTDVQLLQSGWRPEQHTTYLHKQTGSETVAENRVIWRTDSGPYLDSYICYGSSSDPITFDIPINQDTKDLKNVKLTLSVYDVDESSGEVDKVYVNGNYVGTLHGANDSWSVNSYTLNAAWLKGGTATSPGHNIIITVDLTVTGWCVTVDWGAISADANVFSAVSYTPKSAQAQVDFTAPDIKVTFSAEPDMSTISTTTFQVAYFDQSSALVPVNGSYAASGNTVTFTPSGSLLDGVKYAVQLSAGTLGIKSKAGAQLDKQVKWNFTTTPNIVIDKVVPVQTSEGSDMIALKRGMIRVYATWDLKPQVHLKAQADHVTAKVSVESNSIAAGTQSVTIKRRDLITGGEIRTGRQSVNFFNWFPPLGGNSLKATVEITEHNAAIAKTEKTSSYATQSKFVDLRFQYYALQVGAWATTPASVPWATLNLNAQQARTGMEQQFPIQSAASSSGGLFNPGLPKPTRYFYISELNYVAMRLYEQWERTLQASGTQFIVAYVPAGYLGAGVVGGEGFSGVITNYGGTAVSMLTETANSAILPHEIGHAWTLGHTGSSPSIEGYEIDLGGARGRQRSISAGNFVTSLMDPTPNPTDAAFIQNSDYNTLLSSAHKSTMQVLERAAATPVFLIAGFFDPADVVTLDPIRRQDFTNLNPPTTGAYTIEQLNSSSTVIATNNFDPAAPILGTDSRLYRMFSVGVPYNAATQRIRIKKGATQLQEIIRSTNAPVVTITAPTANAIWNGQRTVTWTGTDADGNTLTYDVSYSADNGATWQVLALETSATSLLLSTDLIPQGSSCRLNVSASDGFNTTIATVNFTVANGLKVMSTIPAVSASGVPLSSSVQAQFGSALQSSSITSSNFTLTAGGTAVSGTVSYSAATKVFRFVPTAEFSYNTLYTARVKAGIQDSSGNALASDYTWTFTTETDASSLEVESVSPEAATVGVAVNAPISIKFTKPVNTSTLNTTSVRLVSQTGTTVAGSVTYDAVQRLATFKANASLATNTRYTCTLTTAVMSSDAKPLSAQYDWFFVTGTDSTSAIAFTGKFADRTVDKNGNGLSDSLLVDIEVTAVVAGTYSINGRLADSHGNEIMWAARQNLSLPVGTSIITLPFDGKLINTYSTDGPYQVTDLMIYNSQNTNISDWLSFATTTATYHYTQFEQSTTPAAIDFYPSEGATQVPVNVVVSVRFTRQMDPSTITTSSFTLRDYQNAIVPATVSYDTATKVASLHPTSVLLADSLYSVALTAPIRGANGTALVKYYTWSFATGGGSAAVTSIGEVISYPNPFPHESLPSGGMRFTYVLAGPGKVKIRIYSVAADFIMEIPETIAPARQGYNEIGWNGINQGGNPVASGTYVYIIYYTDADNAEHRATGKFTVVR